MILTARINGKDYIIYVGGLILSEKVKDVDNVIGIAREAAKRHQCMAIQLTDAAAIASWRHLFHSALLAIKAFTRGYNVAEALDVEVLLYASGSKQIHDAISKLGIKPGLSKLALTCIGCVDETSIKQAVEEVLNLLKGLEDDSVLEVDERKSDGIKRLFGISDEEVQATLTGDVDPLVKCVLNRVALVDILKRL
ncbi:MAG: KEOPS complex subunit Cgi121 [Candidatus Nezhaarchaeales archaeon]